MNENGMIKLGKTLAEVGVYGNAADRRWFIENPNRQFRLRYATMEEYDNAFPVVIVGRFADGSQLVMPVPIKKKEVEDLDKFSEATLQEVWLKLEEMIDCMRKQDKKMQSK